MTKLMRLCLIALLLLAPAATLAAPCWMKSAPQATMPCHQTMKEQKPCTHLTVADCAAPQMSSADGPQLAKAQMIGVEYVIPVIPTPANRVQPLMTVMSHAPPETSHQLLSILLTTQRYLI